ncbi:hypothetical protein [Streptomyces sp. NBC_01217]|uniref:hypothetical protein n=1 Tax=Streptomyces sp. NBC_01217 TaxID=2903779 RepID=UPI002E0F0A35|nr:hypothetical protein OG507_12990 [Streptomyces sp. NBC_01217]
MPPPTITSRTPATSQGSAKQETAADSRGSRALAVTLISPHSSWGRVGPLFGQPDPLAGQQLGGDVLEVAGEQGAAEEALGPEGDPGVEGDVAPVVERVRDDGPALPGAGDQRLGVLDPDVVHGERGHGRSVDPQMDPGDGSRVAGVGEDVEVRALSGVRGGGGRVDRPAAVVRGVDGGGAEQRRR